VSIVKNSVGISFPPAISTNTDPSLRPRPVRVTTPMMIPAHAVAASTPRAARAPASKARTISIGGMRVLFFSQDDIMESTIAHNAALIGVYPDTSK